MVLSAGAQGIIVPALVDSLVSLADGGTAKIKHNTVMERDITAETTGGVVSARIPTCLKGGKGLPRDQPASAVSRLSGLGSSVGHDSTRGGSGVTRGVDSSLTDSTS